ncbi:MAG: hypothetical protein B6I36_04865 [Desulfobacteraceae bacterium 4572_35.1]|nr:MAG: hypothetical protein B6I36_04865 [Desulfobacteraceae bacterium 4572_35.1]
MKIKALLLIVVLLATATVAMAANVDDVEIVAEGCGQTLDSALLDAKRCSFYGRYSRGPGCFENSP